MLNCTNTCKELRKAIRNLWPKRKQVRQALGQLNVVVDWIRSIGYTSSHRSIILKLTTYTEIWVDHLESSAPGSVDALIKTTVKQEYEAWTDEHAANVGIYRSYIDTYSAKGVVGSS